MDREPETRLVLMGERSGKYASDYIVTKCKGEISWTPQSHQAIDISYIYQVVDLRPFYHQAAPEGRGRSENHRVSS